MACEDRLQPAVEYLRRGEALSLDVSAVVTGPAIMPDWSGTDFTILFDGPTQADGLPGVQYVFEWRPGDVSSPYYSYSGTLGDPLMFDLPSSWTGNSSYFYDGEWTIGFAYLNPETNQDEIGTMTLVVTSFPSGRPWPTVPMTGTIYSLDFSKERNSQYSIFPLLGW